MMMACDRAIGPFASPELARRAFDLLAGKFAKGIAYDKSSARIKDIDGRLHLHDELQHISKACVSPYAGTRSQASKNSAWSPTRFTNCCATRWS